MDTAEFLRRVVPTEGEYLTITWPGKDRARGWPSRSFPPVKGLDAAIGWVRWATRNNIDVYHALAAFAIGDPRVDSQGHAYVHAPRTQGNAQLLRVLFLDADVKREGDGKDAAKVFADRKAALDWLFAFCASVSLPKPTIIVDSGYGYHWYWVLETALSQPAWHVLATALKSAVVANNFVGDTAFINDAARILRPPGSVNMKSGKPVAVKIVGKPGVDIPNAAIEQVLSPWIVQATGTHGGGGRTATIISLGPRPAHVTPGDTALNDAAAAGIEKRDWKFAVIAQKCEQVKRTLDNGGAGDDYHLWTAHHTLAVHCSDGAEHIHAFSERDPRYNHDANEHKFAQTQREIDRRGVGAPRCTTYQSYRSGVCETCPWFGKLNSPISLGVDDGDLPFGYRRRALAGGTRIEWQNADDDWVSVINGDAYAPHLDHLGTGGYMLSFTHELGGTRSPVSCKGAEMGHPLTIMGIVEKQGISADRHTAGRVGDFVVAWINQLRSQRVERAITLKPFGWNYNLKGERVGLAIAGTHYRRDGTEEPIAGGDPKIRAMYQPMGTFEQWRRTAALFEGRRPDLQIAIAASFASPLIGLLGDVRGVSLNLWSAESGVGKTSAFKFGQSVWGDVAAMGSMNDTPNAAMRSLSEPRVLARYWDELRVLRKWHEHWVEMIYTIPQGRERARMQSDTTLRDVGAWEAMLVFNSNRPYSDVLLTATAGTDSGLYRLLEVELRKEAQQYQADAGPVLKLAETNYGHAGRIYAKYLGANSASVELLLHHTAKKVSDALGARQEERFYVAAIATLIVGAKLATQLKLFSFDVPGMYRHLTRAFQRSRATVESRAMVAPTGGYDLAQVVADYYYATADVRLRTDIFATRGGTTKVIVSATPPKGITQVHYRTKKELLRTARGYLTDWLNERNLPGSVIIEQLRREFNATVHRQVLGGGTNFAGPKTWVVDIPLTAAMVELMDEDGEDEDDSAPEETRQRPAATALKGNEVAL